MKKELVALLALSTSTIIASGCCGYTPIKKTADILKEDNSKIAVTINKDYSATKINVNTGERITPCRTDIPANKSLKELREEIQKCLPKGHGDIGKVITRGEYMLFEGSYCFADIVFGELTVYCQPPENLGF